MRNKYFQGTLDFACGIYAVINALAYTREIDLATGRRIYRETIENIATCPVLWEAFMRNNTDHYWVIRYMLAYWCTQPRFAFHIKQPFSTCLLPESADKNLETLDAFLPEMELTNKHGIQIVPKEEIAYSWEIMQSWLTEGIPLTRVALFRFHRFFPMHPQPLVSHWTTATAISREAITLHDASSDPGSLQSIERAMMIPKQGAPHVRIPFESILLLEKK